VKIKRAVLTEDFHLDFTAINEAVDENTRLIFICSPNNPTGNSFGREDILDLAKNFHGIVVVDEAYVHFSGEKSLGGRNK
jgi:histidinol-phosphate aminotransferase